MRQMTSTLKTYRTSASNIGFAGKLVSQENLFFVTFAKIFIIILVAKQITFNAKVSDITILRFFNKQRRWH